MKKNINASIWEIIPLYAFRKMFPQLAFTNEYNLNDVEANTNVETTNRRYDIYSPVKKIAIEISRINAHSTKEALERDILKQQFSNEAGVTLFHIRDSRCDQSNFTNVHTFTVTKNTGDIFYPINTLCLAIEQTAFDIERYCHINRKTSINYGECIEDIKDFYYKITGKIFDASQLSDLNDEYLADQLGIPVESFNEFKKMRNLSADEAFILLQNNPTKYVSNGAFLTKNASEAVQASKVIEDLQSQIEEKDRQLQILRDIISNETGRKLPKKYVTVQSDFEILKSKSSKKLAIQRREPSKIILNNHD